jgi:DUF971 family protein
MYPEAISNDTTAGIMEIRWLDGTQQKLGNAFLRENCQCANCKTRRRDSGDPLRVASHLRVKEIIPVGSYGVQLIFSDGHVRGIFPWRYLKSLTNESLLDAH